jgi:microcystin degradation protein MlrC
MVAPQDKFLTSDGPMKQWFEAAREVERHHGVISTSTFPMQPWLDVEEAGWAAVVYTNDDPRLAKVLAAQLANKAWALRDQFLVSDRLLPEEAIRQAVAAEEGLIVLSDTGDSVLGGAPGDSTCLLKEMLRQEIECVALLPMVDPESVELAARAGVGSDVVLILGGNRDDLPGKPVRLAGRVKGISEGLEVELQGYGPVDLGKAVLFEVGCIKVVLAEYRGFGINHPILYTHFGLDPAEAKLVVVKTGSNFQYYAPWSKKLIRVDTPGSTQSDLGAFDWVRVPRPIYPLDEIPDWRAKP